MSIKEATHKHCKITGLYRYASEKRAEATIYNFVADLFTEVDFWDKYRNKWEHSYSVVRDDLIELTEAEKETL